MGSGLILLVIVGAWLAVLVPMALRRHDSATSLKSTDRFSDAMRVLSRKGARDVLVPRRRQTLVVSQTRSARPAARATGVTPATGVTATTAATRVTADTGVAATTGVTGVAATTWPLPAAPVELARAQLPAPGRTAAERRRRALLVLVGLMLLTLIAGLVGPAPLLGVHVACDLLLVAFVVHLRRQAVLRQQVLRRRARAAAHGFTPVARSARIAGIPERMPRRPRPVTVPLPAPAARHEDPLPATGTDGSSWSPVPVPPPVYAGKAVAPPRPTRVLDLTRPGRWSSGEQELAQLLDDSDGADLDEILDRRRVVGGW